MDTGYLLAESEPDRLMLEPDSRNCADLFSHAGIVVLDIQTGGY